MVLGVKMSDTKELKSIDLSSFTIIGTGINIVISILLSIIVIIAIGVISPVNLGVSIYIVPTIIVGSFMCGIYQFFSNGLFYNLLSAKLRNIKLTVIDDKLVKMSTTETATIIGVITLIQTVLLYLVSVFILPLVINATIQTLVFGGQQEVAYTFYQLLLILSQPMTIIMLIFGSFIITFIFVLLGTYIYNFLASKGKGVILKLTKENEMTSIDSIDMMSLAIAVAIISAILHLISGIIMLISGGNITSVITGVIINLIAGFVIAAIVAVVYNFLAPKLGKLKIELID